MAEPALRLVDADGVIVGEEGAGEKEHRTELEMLRREVAALNDQLEGAEREVRAWRARFADLARDKDAEARKHPLYTRAEGLFNEWRILCRHPRAKWSPDRFKVVQPFLKSDGYDLCLLAIQGAALDPYTKPRANGSIKRFDDFELVFRDRYKFEEFCARAPAEALKAYRAKVEAMGVDE